MHHMKNTVLSGLLLLFVAVSRLSAQDTAFIHPATKAKGWTNLFNTSLSNAIFPEGIWTIQDGVLTASKDEAIWSQKEYDDFVLDLEFKNAEGTGGKPFYK
ncbi:MAG: hypothetical protein NVSMB7_00760 [Chitinophagaceae bacterium]